MKTLLIICSFLLCNSLSFGQHAKKIDDPVTFKVAPLSLKYTPINKKTNNTLGFFSSIVSERYSQNPTLNEAFNKTINNKYFSSCSSNFFIKNPYEVYKLGQISK